MFERFTERARQVIVFAQDSARSSHHIEITTGHLLDGLVREEQGLAARVLEDLKVTHEDVKAYMIDNMEQASGIPEGQLQFSPTAKRSFELALREALSLGHNYIGTEHLLLGLLRGDTPNTGDELFAVDFLVQTLSVETIRDCIMRGLSQRERNQDPPAKISFTEAEGHQYKLVLSEEAVNALWDWIQLQSVGQSWIRELYAELKRTGIGNA